MVSRICEWRQNIKKLKSEKPRSKSVLMLRLSLGFGKESLWGRQPQMHSSASESSLLQGRFLIKSGSTLVLVGSWKYFSCHAAQPLAVWYTLYRRMTQQYLIIFWRVNNFIEFANLSLPSLQDLIHLCPSWLTKYQNIFFLHFWC